MNTLDDFVEFLAKQWSGKPDALHLDISSDMDRALPPFSLHNERSYKPWHWYPITSHPCWKEWKSGGQSTSSLQLQNAERVSMWWCASLEEAAKHYSWTPSPHGTFVSLRTVLRATMIASDVRGAASVCHRILDWGGVAKKTNDASRLWIKDQEYAGTLIQALSCAVSHLHPSAAALSRFDYNGADIPMNSATTKLFAAADPSNATLIFDGRVGAALCLLVRRYLEVRQLPLAVPPDLLFYWGKHRTKPLLRNPSNTGFAFSEINQVSNIARAQASQRANIVAHRMHEIKGISAEDLERALFMVGYAVNV